MSLSAGAQGVRRLYMAMRRVVRKRMEVDRVKSNLSMLTALNTIEPRRATKLAVFMVCAASAFLVTSPLSLAGDIDWSLSVDISSKPSKLELSPVDRGSAFEIWAEVISSSYSVSIGFVKALYDRGYDYGEVALMLELSSVSGKKPSEVAVLRKKGLGWGVIAKKLGIHPSRLKRAKGNESLFRRYVLADRLAGYYGIPDSKGLVILSKKGYGFDEVVLAVNLCAHSGAPLREVIKAREKSPKWKRVAEKFKLSPVKLSAPPAKLKAEKAKAKAKAQESTKGKAEGKGLEKGKKKTDEKKGSGEKDHTKGCPAS